MRRNPSHKTYERRWRAISRALEQAAAPAAIPCSCAPGDCPDKPPLDWPGTRESWAEEGRTPPKRSEP